MQCTIIVATSVVAMEEAINDWLDDNFNDKSHVHIRHVAMSEGTAEPVQIKVLILYDVIGDIS